VPSPGNHAGEAPLRQGKSAVTEKSRGAPAHASIRRMKWLLGLILIVALIAAALLAPIQGRSLWSRGAVREVAHFVAHGLRAGWDAMASNKDHPKPTRTPPAHSPKPKPPAKAQASAAPRTSREGIVQQQPKENLKPSDQQALQDLIAHSR
jgi:hypothetical protein